MKTFRATLVRSLVCLASFALAAPASAAESSEAPAAASHRLHLDLETDPTAFVFRGYSLHAGLGWKHVRLDLGVYAMDVPGFVEPNAGFTSSFHGAGAKLQLFVLDEQQGPFVGVDTGYAHLRAELERTGAHGSQDQVTAGVNAGWRFALPYGFYATPWIGVGYALNATDMNVGGKTYQPNPLTIFPAVHLGYRFM